jgi:hypothetical protein
MGRNKPLLPDSKKGESTVNGDQYSTIATALSMVGMIARGGFRVRPDDAVPPLGDGRAARTVVIAGNAGPAMWRAFRADIRPGPDPLDRWCRSVLAEIAKEIGAGLVLPSDGPPYAPFQRWAMRAEAVFISPLGLLIHPKWGLWHGYRGAFLVGEPFDVPPREAGQSPCESCPEKPCLTTCPVGAFTGEDYRVDDCTAYLHRPDGSSCLTGGCRARRACPVGKNHLPEPDQAGFHMQAFLASRP